MGVLHVQAAVDPPDLAGDIPGGVGGEKVDNTRNLFRLRDTAHGNLGPDLVKNFLRYPLEHLRGDVARGDRVDRDADPVAAELSRATEMEHCLTRKRLCQAENA